jgi:hypothetical protein
MAQWLQREEGVGAVTEECQVFPVDKINMGSED